MTDITEGNTVTWTEWGRLWRGEVLRVGVLHTLVRPILPVGSVNWIATARLTKVEEGREKVAEWLRYG